MRQGFEDRAEAGKVLAGLLVEHAGQPDVIVLALPRGGVPVAAEVARALEAPLDVFIVHKLGVPGHEELAMGAIAGGGVRVVNHMVVSELGIDAAAIERIATRETQELRRREIAYRGDRPPPRLEGRTVILVDDGLATGSTMRAAIAAAKAQKPARVVVAVPVGAAPTCDELRREADEVVCALTPMPMTAIGTWYRDFTQLSDEDVRLLLDGIPG